MNILYLYADDKIEWNCSNWRVAIPAAAINKTSEHKAKAMYVAEWAAKSRNDPETKAATENADIIILQRLMLDNIIEEMFWWRSQGKIFLVDLDDAYSLMPMSSKSYG
ncbi:MAG: hypothetical protein WBP54_09410, partial [Pelodictyon phaeoclathratiforme]